MKIDHLALWTADLERSKDFYVRYFSATAGDKYHNSGKQFSSYFLSFANKTRLEIMHRPDVAEHRKTFGAEIMGLNHFAIALGSKENVLALTEKLRADGYTIAGEARTTGDGYFESVVLDPDGNRIELTV